MSYLRILSAALIVSFASTALAGIANSGTLPRNPPGTNTAARLLASASQLAAVKFNPLNVNDPVGRVPFRVASK